MAIFIGPAPFLNAIFNLLTCLELIHTYPQPIGFWVPFTTGTDTIKKLFLPLNSCTALFRVDQNASLFHSGESAEHARAERVVRVREARRDLRQGQGQHDHLPPRRKEGEGPLNGLM